MIPTRMLAAGLLLFAVVACDDDPTDPTRNEVSGAYAATTLVALTAMAEVDFLAAGATLDITLNADGSTTGTFFIPDGGEDGGDLLEDLTGTWSLDDDEVDFNHPAGDTFIRDVAWTYANGRLSSETAEFRAVLTRE